MVNFFYVNNINTLAKTARARQVYENDSVLKKIFSSHYQSLLPDDMFLTRIIKSDSSLIRKVLFFLFFLIKLSSLDKKFYVYSRNLYLLEVARKKGFKTVWEAHDLPQGRNKDSLTNLSQSSYFVAISNALKNKISEVYSIPLTNILVAHDGVDLTSYDKFRDLNKVDLRNQLGLPIDKKIIMHTGSLFRNRGVELFGVVLEELSDYIFVQVGGSNKDVTFWKKYFNKYSNIIFIEHQEVQKLIKYQLSSDLLFYMTSKNSPIYWCTSPMKAFEYLGCGIPIIASNIGSLSEIFNETNSVTFDSSDQNSLINALQFVGKNKDEIEKRSKQALVDVRNDFTWEIRANKIKIFLESCSNH
ncbi:MAG: hypothetical protein COA79_00260 [Planctomycetota bacterium]|nr:MAG: hypothetical protein COA79_00260 [Planctomycetota bacterium]